MGLDCSISIAQIKGGNMDNDECTYKLLETLKLPSNISLNWFLMSWYITLSWAKLQEEESKLAIQRTHQNVFQKWDKYA